MASQDMLFPILPRNTRIDVRDPNLRVSRTEKAQRGKRVQDDESQDVTQEARVHQHYHPESDDSADEQTNEEHRHIAREDTVAGQGQNPALELTEPPPVATDPRRKSDDDDDSHKGVNLDTYA